MIIAPPRTLKEWNSALVSVVFLNPIRALTKLSRIDVTGRIFEQLAGDRSSAEAKRNFIAAFGRDPRSIREHFNCSPRNAVLTKKDGIPPNFAALYLSLLAASADDDTYTEGKFRSRFAALMQIDELHSFGFHDLPQLWRELAGWSRRRSESAGDCAQLLLPDPPQSEKLIGHSKRLAFPCYKDEIQLRSLLAAAKLDSSSKFEEVNRAVHDRLALFSASFKDEIAAFNALVSAALMQDAYDSPFWGAVSDITREEEDQQFLTNGRFCIQLDATDPFSPDFCFLSDDVGASALKVNNISPLSMRSGVYGWSWNGQDAKSTIAFLVAFASRYQGFARSKAGAALRAGCLPFFLDSLGSMSSDGHYFDDGPACILLRSDHAPGVLAMSKHLGLKCEEMGRSGSLGSWVICAFSSLSRACLGRLAAELPEGARRFLEQGWSPAQPRIAGAARYGQAVLLNPASNPTIRLAGAICGHYRILGKADAVLAAGELVASNDGFYIPPASLAALSGQLSCRYTLQVGEAGGTSVLNVPVLANVPSAPVRVLLDKDAWLVDGPLGTLQALAETGIAYPAGRTTAGSAIGLIGKPRALFAKSEAAALAKCVRTDLQALPAVLDWLAEALSLRYQRRATLPFKELDVHLKMASEATKIPRWKLLRILFASGWLQTMESRLSPHRIAALGERTISFSEDSDGVAARICGMLTKHERLVLQNSLGTGESATRLAVPERALFVSCIELRLSEAGRPAQLASHLGLRLVSREHRACSPLSGLLQNMTKAVQVNSPPRDADVSIWIESQHQWTAVAGFDNAMLGGALLKAEGRQRNTYWIKAAGYYWQTDSFAWALAIKAACSSAGLGTMSQNGDVDWSSELIALPCTISNWWMRFGGGSLAIAHDGHLAFLGGSGLDAWEGIAFPGHASGFAKVYENKADLRRLLALKIRRAR